MNLRHNNPVNRQALVQLPKSYKALRTLGQLQRERILNTEDQGTHIVTHRELRFNGLELVVATSSDKPNQYVLSKAILSGRSWKILPKDGELEFSGDKDSIRVNLAAGRVLDVEYSCYPG